MKKTSTQKLRLGLFVVIGTILFITAVYLIGQRQNMFQETFALNAYFQNVNGLQKGNNVRYSGIDVGTVKQIKMENDSSIRVVMVLEGKIMNHIRKNAIATIGSDGLVGSMVVNIVPGEGTEPLITDNDTIMSFSKLGADDILSTLSVGSENAAILTADLLKITDRIIDGRGTLGILLNDSIMAKDLKQSILNLKHASQGASGSIKELNELVKQLRTDNESILGTLLNDSVSGNQLKSIIATLETSSKEIEQTVTGINNLVSDINNDQGAINYILKDTSLVNNLKSTIRNIDQGTEKFNENMEALKHNFLTRGYFRKLEREEKKKSKNDKAN